MNKLLTAIVLLAFQLQSAAQEFKTITGVVKDVETGEPIAFVNIGILNSEVGTISNSDGSFQLRIPEKFKLKVIIFSAIGYERIQLPVPGSSVTALKIKLAQKSTVLKNVEVYGSKNLKEVWHGNNRKAIFPGGVTHYDSASAGGAMALMVNKKDSALKFIQQAKLFILRNTIKDMKIRIGFLEVDTLNDNIPGKELIDQSIIVSTSDWKGWLNFDLSDYNIVLTQKRFYIMFEWLFEESDRHTISQVYSDFAINNPDKVVRDTVIVDGVGVPTVDFKNPIIVGTFFAISPYNKSSTDVTYSRTHSFATWERSAYNLRATVLITD